MIIFNFFFVGNIIFGLYVLCFVEEGFRGGVLCVQRNLCMERYCKWKNGSVCMYLNLRLCKFVICLIVLSGLLWSGFSVQ